MMSKKILFFVSVCGLLCCAVSAQSLGDMLDGEGRNKPVASSRNTAAAENTAVERRSEAVQKTAVNEVPQSEFDEIFLKASGGDSNAQLALGSFYARGIKPAVADARLALEWLEKSAAQNNATAMNYLGVIYGEGKIVPRDFKKAVYWREKAAENASAAEKYALATAFIYGYMLPSDAKKAREWLEKAALDGNMDAANQLVSISRNAGDKEAVRRWNEVKSNAQLKLAAAGDVSAMFEVYRKYLTGRGGFYKSVPKAIYWLRRAAESGHRTAAETLANMHLSGRYVGRDFDAGIAILAKLAETDANMAIRIADIYAAEGENRDPKKAGLWLEKADFERLSAANKIRVIWKYWAGAGVAKNPEKAAEYCDKILSAENMQGTHKFVEKIKNSIKSGNPAPEKFADLYRL